MCEINKPPTPNKLLLSKSIEKVTRINFIYRNKIIINMQPLLHENHYGVRSKENPHHYNICI